MDSAPSSQAGPDGDGLSAGIIVLIGGAAVVVIGGAVVLILWKKGVLFKKG